MARPKTIPRVSGLILELESQWSNMDLGSALVEDDVVVLDENVAEDGEIHVVVAKARSARATAVLEDEVCGWDGKRATSDGKGEVAESGSVAGDSVCAVTVVGGAQLRSKVGGDVESGPGVDDAREAADAGAGHAQGVDSYTPETLRVVYGDSGQGATNLALVVTAKDVFTTTAVRLFAEEDTKHGVADEVLADEVVNRRLNSRNGREGVESQT
ncbi:hypothetical protein BC937DRAFT_89393 [Endogone sp. FLAS-F59071]|nr:hypothetical protein BC937DRAFT_89393 [Endogone sp. FLAS-F59071]|eukprot:RUS17873.1 hypothetical protein BC937DRAFT_89393 [Endogone sp. FLAS-F59071]